MKATKQAAALFVTFRSMEGAERAIKCSKSSYSLLSSFKPKFQSNSPHKNGILDLAPNITRAASPDEIIWENLGASPRKQFVQTIVTYLLSVVILFVTILVIVQLRGIGNNRTLDGDCDNIY